MHNDTIRLRAMFKFPVRLSSLSVTTPPSVSPSTPAKKTPEANAADFPMSRWWLCRKY
jgi:hypothetical protein